MIERGFRTIGLNNQLEAVIQDLDRDTMLEIAAGVSQLNYTVEQVRGDIASTKLGNGQSKFCLRLDIIKELPEYIPVSTAINLQGI